MDMDRYEFRGKNIDDNKWIYGNLIMIEEPDGLECYITKSKNSCEQVYKNTVSKCTGLKNRYGVLMYEGDIIRTWVYRRNYSEDGMDYLNGVITWDEFKYVVKFFNRTIPLEDLDYDLSVEGNIYDNPKSVLWYTRRA